jgi:hypothetical protein
VSIKIRIYLEVIHFKVAHLVIKTPVKWGNEQSRQKEEKKFTSRKLEMQIWLFTEAWQRDQQRRAGQRGQQ